MKEKSVKFKNKHIYVVAFSLIIIGLFSCFSIKAEVFSPEIGVCTNISNSELLATSGYDYIEESVGNFLMPFKSEAEFEAILKKIQNSTIPVKACNGFIPKNLKSIGPESVHSEILEYMETAFRRSEKTGVKYIVFGSGGSRTIPEGFSREEGIKQFVNLCKKMASIAAKYNVVVVLEPLNKKECNFINSLAEGGEIVTKVNHPNFQLLADFYHMKMDDEDPENIVKYGQLIKHIHIAEKKGRSVPGTNNEDFSPYFKALKKINYQGMISIEAGWENIEKQAPLAIKTIKQQIKKIK